MRKGFVKVAFTAAILLMCPWLLCAQPYRQLTPGDFEAAPQHGTSTIAYTHCSIGYQYTAQRKNGYYLLNFEISLEIDRDQSWIDRARITSADMMAEILNHEQGHYIIAYFEQQELLRTVGKTRFGADYKERAQEIFERIHSKYEQLTIDYDEDTGHSQNRTQQHSWDAYFLKRLKYMPPA
ncbi:MAG TPA: DUF922 domain-containing protein [Mucilaginibacter sp.]|nr:DUF922 domain-containing protein [Mucilaginibacter sp.]